MRRLLLLVLIFVASAAIVPVAFSQIEGEGRLALPIALQGALDQEPSPQPSIDPSATAEPTADVSTPTATRATPDVSTPTPCTPEQPPDTYHLQDVAVSLERTVCFGYCPEYTVTIHGDGLVVYEGRRNVAVVGREEDHIERDSVMELLQSFYDTWFFDMRDAYRDHRMLEVDPDGTVHLREGMVTDLPSQIVTFRVAAYEKGVVDYYGPPPGLRELEELIDETAGTDRWVKGTPQP